MNGSVACWSCGRDNTTGRDFCEHCGEYLDWAPTGHVRAVTTEATAAVALDKSPAGVDEPPPAVAPSLDKDAGDGRPPVDGDAPTNPELSFPGERAVAPPDEPPAFHPAPADSPAPAPPIAVSSGDASLSIQPADPDSLGAAGVPAVEAGTVVAFNATIRNESRIVDNFELSLAGLPDDWSLVSPTATFLVPLGSVERAEQDIRIEIAPPREFRATAGIWTFELLAMSRTTGGIAASAAAQFEIRPFQEWSTEVTPTMRSGRRKGKYQIAVRNDGNAAASLWVVAMDEENRVKSEFKRGKLLLEPGAIDNDVLTLKATRPIPIGRRKDHRVGVDVLPAPPDEDEEDEGAAKPGAKARFAKLQPVLRAVGLDISPRGIRFRKPTLQSGAAMAKQKARKLDATTLSKLKGGDGGTEPQVLRGRIVMFRQKPMIPIWLILLLLLLALIGYLIYTNLPDRVDVPRVVGSRDAFTAEKRLRASGLRLAQPIGRRTAPNAVPGSVIGQTPDPGSRLKKGETVSIEVAAGTTRVGVPRLQGLTRVEADERLRASGLSLGDAQPGDAKESFVVRSQIPRAGLAIARGSPVRVFLEPPPSKKKKKGGDDEKKKGGEDEDKEGSKRRKTVVVPPIAKRPPGEYREALTELGLAARTRRVIASSVKTGELLSVDPEPGTKVKEDDVVTVRVSAGSPALAIETDGLITLLDPRAGKERRRFPDGEGTAVEASFSPDGSEVIYRDGEKLVLADAIGDGKRTAYDGEESMRTPSFAPNGATIAMVRQLEGDGDLCFGRITGRRIEPQCLADDGWNLFGRPMWRPDGRAVVVAAHKQGDRRTFGLRLFGASRASTLDPDRWSGRTATDITTPGRGVIAGAWSSDGKRFAAITNLLGPAFVAVTATGDDVELIEPKSTQVRACDLAWRPDNRELAIVEVDAACSKTVGKVLRFDLRSPRETARIASEGQRPLYQPSAD